MMKKFLAGLVLATGLFAQSAWAIEPGLYVAQGTEPETHWGDLVITEFQMASEEPWQMFNLTTYTGAEAVGHYAGLLRVNEEQRAVGTILYTLDNGEAYNLKVGNKVKGHWVQDLNCTAGDIEITKVNNQLQIRTMSPNSENWVACLTGEGYKFHSQIFANRHYPALNILLTERLWESKTPADNAYTAVETNSNALSELENKIRINRFSNSGSDDPTFTIGYSLEEAELSDFASRPAISIENKIKYFQFGNAVIMGTDVSLRSEPNTDCHVYDYLNTGCRLTVINYVEGGYVDGQYQWAHVQLPDGSYGYVYGKFVRADEYIGLRDANGNYVTYRG